MTPSGMEPRTDPRVVPAKVRVPAARLETVHRPRLLDRLEDERMRVVLVSAPAGFGKSMLLLDWLRRSDPAAAWVSIDPLDNDPPRFLAHLSAALRSLEQAGATAAAEALEQLGAAGAARPEGRFLRELAGVEDAVLVLDDVHHLEAPPLLELLHALANHPAGGLRLVLLTRVDPPLALARLRLSGQLLELRERDLRFTAGEAEELFRRLLPALDASHVALIGERTEGWAAGLRLAAAAIERAEDPSAAADAFTGSHELMVDYLLEEVLAGLPEALQTFLMDTSILPRFTAEGCIAVTGDPDAGRHLEEVDRANLFLVSLDESGRRFRYHHLFADLLAYRLRRVHPERAPVLHRRASRWLEEEGDVQEALAQAAQLEDPSRLLELLDRHGYPILARSEFASFARWLGRIPEPESRPYPMFLAALAWYRAQTERAPDLEPLLSALEAAAEDPPPGYPEERAREARLHHAALRAFVLRMTDRLHDALEAADTALQRLPDDAVMIRGVIEFNTGAVHLRLADMGPARTYLELGYEKSLRAGLPYLVLASLAHLGFVAAQTEGLEPARQRLESAVKFAEERGLARVPAFAIVLYQLAQVHYLADRPDQARPLLERALEITRADDETDIRANVLLHLARVEAAAGSLDRADALLAEATSLAHGHNVKPFGTTLDVERARLAEARSGRLQTPASAPPSADPTDAWTSWREVEVMLQAQHSLKLGRREEAAALARRLRQESEPRSRGVALCVAGAIEAATADTTSARRQALAGALDLAATRGYVRPLLDLGPPMADLLAAALSGPLEPHARGFARDTLLPRLEAARGGVPGTGGAADAGESAVSGDDTEATPVATARETIGLTDREIEILRHVASGRTNQAIAREAFVSVNTVKTHLKRVFAKLDVSTRTEAVERARRLGLLDPA